MSSTTFLFSYYSKKMLLTLDLNAAIEVLMERFGDTVLVEFKPMSAEARKETEDASGQITMVTQRFMLRQQLADGALIRHEDVEREVVTRGQK